MIPSLILGLTMLFLSDEKPAAYPRTDLLVEAADLEKDLAGLKSMHVLDARPKAKYAEGHIPGAVWVDAADWAKAFAERQDEDVWAVKIAYVGLTANASVVIYDDNQ